MTVNIDKAVLDKEFQKISEKMEQSKDETVGSITHGIRAPVKGMTYGIVIWGLPKQIWCVNPKFIAAHCTTLYRVNFPKEKEPSFLSTIAQWNIRSEQYGNNNYARTTNGRATWVLGWIYEIPTSSSSAREISKLVQKQANVVRACFKKSDQYSIGNQVLDYIEAHSPEDPSHPGHKAGLYKALTKGVSDTSGVEARLDKDINDFFAPKKRFVNNEHWDKYLTDVDIKEILEKHLGANNWDMVPKDVRKACYKNYKGQESLPKWNLITREGY